MLFFSAEEKSLLLSIFSSVDLEFELLWQEESIFS
jgi:hypothetical protein